jgi:glucuronate isomerase
MLLDPLAQDLYNEFGRLPIIDTHTHLDPSQPAARDLADLLRFHPYAELAVATGMERGLLGPGVAPRDRVRALFYHLCDFYPNTAPYQWLLEIAHAFLGFQRERLTFADCGPLYDAAERLMASPGWVGHVIETANVEKLFLNNAFDDPLEGFDTGRFVPCLAADELVFHLDDAGVRERLAGVTGLAVADAAGLQHALAARLEHFQRHGGKAVTLVVPPGFAPEPVPDEELSRSLGTAARGGDADADVRRRCALGAFRVLVEACATFQVPLQLMVGVSHRAYHQGGGPPPGLFREPAPLALFAELFRSFPSVTFCVSVISAGPHEELTFLSKLFANVFTSGHGGDTGNVPAALERIVRERLQVIPQVKQIGYYSAMDRLEFALPLFNMYRRVLAQTMATEFVRPRVYSLWQAVALGRLLLRDNARRAFDV